MENRLFDLLNKAVSPFACVKAAKDELIECGFEEINYADKWKIKAGGKYVVDHHGTTLFAFAVVSSNLNVTCDLKFIASLQK